MSYEVVYKSSFGDFYTPDEVIERGKKISDCPLWGWGDIKYWQEHCPRHDKTLIQAFKLCDLIALDEDDWTREYSIKKVEDWEGYFITVYDGQETVYTASTAPWVYPEHTLPPNKTRQALYNIDARLSNLERTLAIHGYSC